MIGVNCRALGFNVDFAPALDLAFEASRTVMNSRLVSDDPKETIVYVREFLAGLRAAGVLRVVGVASARSVGAVRKAAAACE